jgi:hypothetical protein
MCTILLAPEMRMTKRLTDGVCYQDLKVKRTEHSEDRKRQLSMKWIVVTDEQDNRRLQMRWYVAQSSNPSRLCKPTARCVQAAMGRVCDPTPGPEVRSAIS